MIPPKVTLKQFKNWRKRRVDKPLLISDQKLKEALDIGNRKAELKFLHSQRHKKEK